MVPVSATDSSVINALINASRNGKYVTVYLELQARFDEEANIYWTERLQEEGVKVIHSIPGYKVHSKLIMIRRKENNKNVLYSLVSTGNFNEDTARIYADDGLLTSNPRVCQDVYNAFHQMETAFKPYRYKSLVLAPFSMRNHFMRMLDGEIRNARAGKKAWVVIKLNNLVDKTIVRKLYRASQAGVKIRLIIRGICVAVPGIPGVSDNIKGVSIVDRFLEHSRILVFCNGGDPQYYISSADWMIRNFDNRMKYNMNRRRFVNSWFWRTYDQKEIDYIEEEGGELTAFEFKLSAGKKTRIPREFQNNYPQASFFQITRDNFWDFIL